MSIEPITAIANAIAEASKVIGQWMASADRRKMKAALDAAERYIFVNEKSGENSKLSEKEREALLKKLRAQFFKFN